MTTEEAKKVLENLKEHTLNYQSGLALDMAISALSADVRPNIHGHWERMSDLPEDKDDRYKCSQCGNVVHHSNGVNLYHFNSWCGRCGSLNNSLIAKQI